MQNVVIFLHVNQSAEVLLSRVQIGRRWGPSKLFPITKIFELCTYKHHFSKFTNNFAQLSEFKKINRENPK
jgi:hypothetical protein